MQTKNTFLVGFLSACLLLTSTLVLTGAKVISDRTQSAVSSETITPSDTVNFTGGLARSTYWGTGGDVAVVDSDGNAVTYHNVPSGSYVIAEAIRINATLTTASQGTAQH